MYYRASGFFFLYFLLEYRILSGENFRFLLFFVILVSGVCLFMYTQSPQLSVLGPWEFLWRAGSCIYSVCLSAVWSGGPVQFYLGTFGGVDGGTVRIFLSLWLCSGGYGTVEMVKGVVRVFLAFSSLLLVLLAVGCLR